MAARARSVKSELMLGKSCKEICFSLGISVGEYRSAMSWIGRAWKDNSEAFAEYRLGEMNRLESIQMRMNAISTDAAITAVDREHLLIKWHSLAHDIRNDIKEMALKLGVLERETFKLETKRPTEVKFGDEVGFWNQKGAPPETSGVVN